MSDSEEEPTAPPHTKEVSSRTAWGAQLMHVCTKFHVRGVRSENEGFISIALRSSIPDLNEFLAAIPASHVGLHPEYGANKTLAATGASLEFSPRRVPRINKSMVVLVILIIFQCVVAYLFRDLIWSGLDKTHVL